MESSEIPPQQQEHAPPSLETYWKNLSEEQQQMIESGVLNFRGLLDPNRMDPWRDREITPDQQKKRNNDLFFTLSLKNVPPETSRAIQQGLDAYLATPPFTKDYQVNLEKSRIGQRVADLMRETLNKNQGEVPQHNQKS